MSDVANQFEDYSIYILLSLRGAEPGFHWCIFIPTSKPRGELWHAVNRSGGWIFETEPTSDIPYSMSLCIALRLGTVTDQTWVALRTTLANVPSSGQPSLNTGETFSCRVWVKDAILALDNAGVIRLAKAVEKIEKEALDAAEKNRPFIEQGTGAAMILNNTGVSAAA